MGCVKTHSGKRNHGGETGRLPPTIEISSSGGTSRWLPVKWNGPSSCELLHYRNPCAQEEHHPLYGKSAPFSYRSKGTNKNDTSRGDEAVQLSPTCSTDHCQFLIHFRFRDVIMHLLMQCDLKLYLCTKRLRNLVVLTLST